MARGKTAKHEAKRSANEDRRQDQRLAQRLSKVERDVGEMRKAAPPRPEDVVAREARPGERMDFMKVRPGNADYGGPVAEHMRRMGGRSMSDLRSDQERGASSPLSKRKR
jgi:hypothetical protein